MGEFDVFLSFFFVFCLLSGQPPTKIGNLVVFFIFFLRFFAFWGVYFEVRLPVKSG